MRFSPCFAKEVNEALALQLSEYEHGLWLQMRQREAYGLAGAMRWTEKTSASNPQTRAILNDWLVDVHQKHNHQRETLWISVQILDRFLAKCCVPRAKLQLTAAAATLIAAKYEEVEPLEIDELVYLSDNSFSNKDIIQMECSILRVLKFDLGCPTGAHFMRHLLGVDKKMNGGVEGCTDPMHPELDMHAKPNFDFMNSNTKEGMAWMLMELSLISHDMLQFAPSLIACAALLLSNEIHKVQPPWPSILSQLSGYSSRGKLTDCVLALNKLAQEAYGNPLMGVRKRWPNMEALFKSL